MLSNLVPRSHAFQSCLALWSPRFTSTLNKLSVERLSLKMILLQALKIRIWVSSWGYGTYHIGDQRRLRRACASVQSGWLRMRVWIRSIRRMKSAIISWAGSFHKLLTLILRMITVIKSSPCVRKKTVNGIRKLITCIIKQQFKIWGTALKMFMALIFRRKKMLKKSVNFMIEYQSILLETHFMFNEKFSTLEHIYEHFPQKWAHHLPVFFQHTWGIVNHLLRD